MIPGQLLSISPDLICYYSTRSLLVFYLDEQPEVQAGLKQKYELQSTESDRIYYKMIMFTHEPVRIRGLLTVIYYTTHCWHCLC